MSYYPHPDQLTPLVTWCLIHKEILLDTWHPQCAVVPEAAWMRCLGCLPIIVTIAAVLVGLVPPVSTTSRKMQLNTLTMIRMKTILSKVSRLSITPFLVLKKWDPLRWWKGIVDDHWLSFVSTKLFSKLEISRHQMRICSISVSPGRHAILNSIYINICTIAQMPVRWAPRNFLSAATPRQVQQEKQ